MSDPAGGHRPPHRPAGDWTSRVARARADGRWFADREELIPLPTRTRRRRFVAGVVGCLALLFSVRFVLDTATQRHAFFSSTELLAGLVHGTVPALVVGIGLALPTKPSPSLTAEVGARPRRRHRSTSG